jgi:fatty-acyl-CoA synthase
LLDAKPEATWFMPQNYEELLADSSVLRPDLMEFDEDSLAELFYTSGTSAEPKGVMLTHRNIYLHGLHAALALEMNQDTVELHTIPLFHANGWGNVHSVTIAGGTHVMAHRFDPAQVFLLIEQERVSSCNLVPTMATALVNSPWLGNYDLSSLQRVILGGAASSPPLVRQVEETLKCRCYSGYGLTETSPILTLSPMKPGMKCDPEQRYAVQAMTGFAMPGVEIRVADHLGNDVRRDGKSVGEILARSDGVMDGYWRQKEPTEIALDGRWFHSGDLATIDENNYVLVVDRKKDMIVSGGENISSLEVEKTLLDHPSVYEVAVIPVPDNHWTEVPKAVVVLKPGASASESELVEFCRSRLARYKCPKSVEFLESLPKNGAGKILKKELRAKHQPVQKTAILFST